MRDANTELTKQLAGLLERQLMLPLMGIVASIQKPKTAAADDTKNKRSRKGRHPGRPAPPPHLERVPQKNPSPSAQSVDRR
jgi:hypothetical protein